MKKKRHIQIKNAILAAYFCASLLCPIPFANAQETSSDFSAGSVIIGQDTRSCDGSLAGALRFNPLADGGSGGSGATCSSSGSQTFSYTGSEQTFTVDAAKAGCVFSVTMKGAGGAGTAAQTQAGGDGGGFSFDFIPDATGTLGIVVGQGGRGSGGRAYGGGASGGSTNGPGGGGASAIKLDSTVIAIAGGGGGESYGYNFSGGDGGAANYPGGDGEGDGGGYNIGGDGGSGLGSEDGGAGGSNGTNGSASANGDLGGLGITTYLIAGGGGGGSSCGPEDGGGGGGGYGGGGGGSCGFTGDGAGGGGYANFYYSYNIDNTPTGGAGGTTGNGTNGEVSISWATGLPAAPGPKIAAEALLFDDYGPTSTISNFTVPDVKNRVLIVMVKTRGDGGSYTGVEFNSVPLTEAINHQYIGPGSDNFTGIYYMLNPPAITANIDVTGPSQSNHIAAYVFRNIKQQGPEASATEEFTSSTNFSTSITTETDNALILNVVGGSTGGGGSIDGVTDPDQNILFFGGDLGNSDATGGSFAVKATAGTTNIGHTVSNTMSNISHSLLAFEYVGGGPAIEYCDATDWTLAGSTGAAPSANAIETIFLTSGTSWTVPADWNDNDNVVHVIGGGGGGANSGGGVEAGGGGGGAYSRTYNLDLTPSGSVTVAVGGGGTEGNAGGDTYFNGASCATASVCADGGKSSFDQARGVGGDNSTGIGDIRMNGGDGGLGGTGPDDGGGGGGGAAGPYGEGGEGGDALGRPSGGGGGGVGGAQPNANGFNTNSSWSGGGGDGPDNNGGPFGESNGSNNPGDAGTNGGGGAGGASGSGIGGAGSMYVYWTQTSDSATAGPAGGSGGSARFGNGTNTVNYGGGGGGKGEDGSTSGDGGDGIIVIQYRPI